MGMIRLTKNMVKYTVRYALMGLGILYLLQSCEANQANTQSLFRASQAYASENGCSQSQRQKAENRILRAEKTIYSDAVFDFLAAYPDGINGYKPGYNKDLSEIFKAEEFPASAEDITGMLEKESFPEQEKKQILEYSAEVQEAFAKADKKEFQVFSRIAENMCLSGEYSGEYSEYAKAEKKIDPEEWDEMNALEKDFLGKIKKLVDYIISTEGFNGLSSRKKKRFFESFDPGTDDYKGFTGLIEARAKIEDIELGYRMEAYK